MKILLAILLGAFFGYALYKVGATSPKKLLSMLRLEDLHLAKVILFAIGFSSVLLYLANLIGIFNLDHLSIKTMNTGVILGGIIFGLGFGSAGTCPGTCVGAASGDNLKKAISTILGGLTGAFAFSMSYASLKSIGLISSLDMSKLTLFNLSPEFPSLFNLGFTGLLITGVLFMGGSLILPNSIIKK